MARQLDDARHIEDEAHIPVPRMARRTAMYVTKTLASPLRQPEPHPRCAGHHRAGAPSTEARGISAEKHNDRQTRITGGGHKRGEVSDLCSWNEEYGVQILKVREIIGCLAITAVPRTPSHIKGS